MGDVQLILFIVTLDWARTIQVTRRLVARLAGSRISEKGRVDYKRWCNDGESDNVGVLGSGKIQVMVQPGRIYVDEKLMRTASSPLANTRRERWINT